MSDPLYDVARDVTDEVLGEGTYAAVNRGNPDPGVQAAIARASAGHRISLVKARDTGRLDAGELVCAVCSCGHYVSTPTGSGFTALKAGQEHADAMVRNARLKAERLRGSGRAEFQPDGKTDWPRFARYLRDTDPAVIGDDLRADLERDLHDLVARGLVEDGQDG